MYVEVILLKLLDFRVTDELGTGAPALSHGLFVLFGGELLVPRGEKLLPEVPLILLLD